MDITLQTTRGSKSSCSLQEPSGNDSPAWHRIASLQIEWARGLRERKEIEPPTQKFFTRLLMFLHYFLWSLLPDFLTRAPTEEVATTEGPSNGESSWNMTGLNLTILIDTWPITGSNCTLTKQRPMNTWHILLQVYCFKLADTEVTLHSSTITSWSATVLSTKFE